MIVHEQNHILAGRPWGLPLEFGTDSLVAAVKLARTDVETEAVISHSFCFYFSRLLAGAGVLQ